jgi:hypothetical protein
LEAALGTLRTCLGENGVLVVAMPNPDQHPRQRLFHLRLWTQAEFFSRLGDLIATQQRPFRLGRLYTLRRSGPSPAG